MMSVSGGSLGLLVGERETGVIPAPCGLQREFRTRRSLSPTQSQAQALRGGLLALPAKEGSFHPWDRRARGLFF